MRNLILIAGAAALAASMPALAEKGGNGGGNGGGKGQAAQAHGGGGKAPRMHAGGQGGGQAKPQKAQRQAAHGGGQGGARQAKPDKAVRHAQRVDKPAKAAKAERKAVRDSVRQDRLVGQRLDDRSRIDTRVFGDGGRFVDARSMAPGQNCPPGLARKGNGCLPPGQAKKIFALGERIRPEWYGGYNLPDRYSAFYRDTDDHYYRYDDNGYIYRVDSGSNLISGLVPLLGGGFAVGQPLPAGYDVYNLPYQYRDAYYDTDDSYYRYGDDAIYRVDAGSGMIESIVALLAGDLNVGQPLPTGYDVYNVPLDYRDRYHDSDEAMYRYADGNIYQVDPQTQIIQAIVEMLV